MKPVGFKPDLEVATLYRGNDLYRTEPNRVVYVSQPIDYYASTLREILLDARRLNARDTITRAIVFRCHIFP